VADTSVAGTSAARAQDAPALRLRELSAWYGRLRVLHGIDLQVPRGAIVGLFGHNGAGKTTLLRAVMGVDVRLQGQVSVDGVDTTGLSPKRLVQRRVAMVPQGVGVFGSLRVGENILLGLPGRPGRDDPRLARLYEWLPLVRERWTDYAGSLSGGQRQLVAIGRALVSEPTLLILDEPSVGLAPRMVATVLELVERLRAEQGLSVLLVEQNIAAARRILDRGYVIRGGRVVLDVPGDELPEAAELMRYF
jgi:branched-chain amino acid transport system ATP-binding protein